MQAADCGLLSPDLAAGIRRVKGAKRLGVRVGNWLAADQGRLLLRASTGTDLRTHRNKATLAVLVGCGLRRAEIVTLRVEDVQLREDHWVIADLIGKGGHMRTVRSTTFLGLINVSSFDWRTAKHSNRSHAARATGFLRCCTSAIVSVPEPSRRRTQ
jgi:site-specific recombinase XerC